MGKLPFWICKFEWSLEIWKLFNRVGPTCQRPVSVWPPGTVARSHAPPLFLMVALTVQRALDASGRRSSPPTWVGPHLSLLRTSTRKPPPTLLFPSHRSAALLATLHCTSHRFARHRPLPTSRPPSCPTGLKERLVAAPLLHQEPTHSSG
jgi:hypothetical protein